MTEQIEGAVRRATTAITKPLTKEWTTKRSDYDWRAIIGVAILASAYLVGRVEDLPAAWAVWIKKADVALGLVGVVLAVQGRPIFRAPTPQDADDERSPS